MLLHYYPLTTQERAEVRAARVSLVVGLMSLLPRRAYRATVSWLLTLSATAKVAHRHIAMVSIVLNLLGQVIYTYISSRVVHDDCNLRKDSQR